MDEIICRLTHPEWVSSRAEILSKPCPVDHKPGIYAWYFQEIPPGVPIEACFTYQGLTLLYGGISPSEPSTRTGIASQQNLYKRIHDHLCGNAYGSTLRKSLG